MKRARLVCPLTNSIDERCATVGIVQRFQEQMMHGLEPVTIQQPLSPAFGEIPGLRPGNSSCQRLLVFLKKAIDLPQPHDVSPLRGRNKISNVVHQHNVRQII